MRKKSVKILKKTEKEEEDRVLQGLKMLAEELSSLEISELDVLKLKRAELDREIANLTPFVLG